MPRSALPDKEIKVSLRWTTHWDYPAGLKWVPRAWTSFDWGKPKMVAGTQKEVRAGAPAPIGEAESWQVSRFPRAPIPLRWIPLYFAISFKTGADGKYRHFRAGARYDDVDGYTTLPTFATRKYTGDPHEDTSTGPMKKG